MDGAQAAATHMPSAAAATTEVDSSATATEVHSAATAATAAPKGKCITRGDQGTEGHTGRKNPQWTLAHGCYLLTGNLCGGKPRLP